MNNIEIGWLCTSVIATIVLVWLLGQLEIEKGRARLQGSMGEPWTTAYP